MTHDEWLRRLVEKGVFVVPEGMTAEEHLKNRREIRENIEHQYVVETGRSDGTWVLDTTTRLDDGSLIPADILIIGIGIIPNQELAENAGLDCNNGILVNDKGITSDQSIFACGDCTNHPNKFLNKNVRL